MARTPTSAQVSQPAETETKTTESIAEVHASTQAKKEIGSIDLSSCGSNKSKAMRMLSAEGFSTGEIAKFLSKHPVISPGKDVRYQFVRNVLNQKTKAA